MIIGMSAIGTSVASLPPMVIEKIVGPEYVTSGTSIQFLLHGISLPFSTFIGGWIFAYIFQSVKLQAVKYICSMK